MSILHIITGLNVGGAETMLAKLIEEGVGGDGMAPEVLSLLPPGRLAERIRAAGATVHSAGMARALPTPSQLASIARTVRAVRPRLLQGWMHHGNLAATFGARVVPSRPPVVWNIRHSLTDIALEKPLSRLVLRVGRLLSRSPSAIVYNSDVAARQYSAFGYAADRAVVIPNGFDCAQFRLRPAARAALRHVYGIAAEATVVAMVARQHPMKDTPLLIEAVARARAVGHDLHLLLVGTGTEGLAPDLTGRLPATRITLAGERGDVHEWLSGVDIVALSSAWGEGFPNILGEAMASGVPCVATTVGDSAAIVGEFGRTVPPRDAAAFAAALGALTELGPIGRARLGEAARRRVVDNYGLDRIAARYAALYHQVLEARLGTPDRTPNSWTAEAA